VNTKDLIRLGVPFGKPVALAREFVDNFIARHDGALLEAEVSTSSPTRRRSSPTNCGHRGLHDLSPGVQLPLRRLRGHRSALAG